MINFIKCLLCSFFLCLCFSIAQAETSHESIRLCRQYMKENPPKINIYYNYGDLKYNTSQDTKSLEKLYEQISNRKVLENSKIRGLTRLRPYALMNTQTQQKVLPSGRICSIPAKIEITIGYDNPTIYLSNSLKEGSCRYKLTLRHELTHLDIGHSALYFLGKALKNEIPQAVNEIGPKVISTNNEVNMAQKLNDLYQNRISAIMEIYKKTLIQEQARLDTQENYQYESNLCPR